MGCGYKNSLAKLINFYVLIRFCVKQLGECPWCAGSPEIEINQTDENLTLDAHPLSLSSGLPSPGYQVWALARVRSEGGLLCVQDMPVSISPPPFPLACFVDCPFMTHTQYVILGFWEIALLWPSTPFNLCLLDPPSFQPSPRFNSELWARSLSPVSRSAIAWGSVWQLQRMLRTGWQCNTRWVCLCHKSQKTYIYVTQGMWAGFTMRGTCSITATSCIVCLLLDKWQSILCSLLASCYIHPLVWSF